MKITGNVKADPILFDPSYTSAFGTLETAELTPVFQGDFVYGLNTQIWNTPTVSGAGATVDTSVGRLRIQSGTSGSGYAYITCKRILRYRAGQGIVVRMTPLFTQGVEGNVQYWGIGAITSNALSDGYFFGWNGGTFGIAHYNNGSLYRFYPQNEWDVDRCDGAFGSSFAWNPSLGSPVMIKYPYLGYGNIEFFVQNPTTGRWVLCHIIQYANTTATTQLSNPSMQVIGFTLNSGNTANRIMYCASVGVFISGERSFVGNPRWAADSAGLVSIGTGVKGIVAANENCLLNLRNCTTYNGVTNKGMMRLNSLSIGSSTGNANVIIRLLINATFSTTPVYTPINGTTADNGVTLTAANSIASVDVAGTTITSLANRGIYIFNMSLGASGSNVIDLEPFDLFINPTEVLTISGQSSTNANVTASINWSEDI
jgi:hypothetical protein